MAPFQKVKSAKSCRLQRHARVDDDDDDDDDAGGGDASGVFVWSDGSTENEEDAADTSNPRVASEGKG